MFVYMCTYMYIHTLVRTVYTHHTPRRRYVHMHARTTTCMHAHPHRNSPDIRVYTQDTLYVTIQPPELYLNKIHAKDIY